MKTATANRTTVLTRSARFFGAMLMCAIMVQATAVSQVVYTNPVPVVLGTAGNYRALSGTTLNIGATCVVNGNAGGVSVTDNGSVTGTTDVGNAAVTTALGDLTTVKTDLAGRAPNATLITELGGVLLGRGVYFSGTFGINGILTLTGTASDIFIFQTTTTLITGTSCQVNLTGGALASNIYWQVGSAATIDGAIKGNILAQTFITQNGAATIDGRALAQTAVTLNGTSILPVEIVAFTGSADRMNANLHWSTATEVHNYGFEIERRQTSDWSKVGFVAGAGSSSSPRNYSFADKNLPDGRYTYRLKQVDNSGAFSYYGAVEVEIGSTPREFALLQNYPNPFNPSTKIQYNLAKADQVSLKVYNMLGSEVATLVNERQEAGSYTVSFTTNKERLDLASGVYVYRLEAGSFVSTKKLVLMK